MISFNIEKLPSVSSTVTGRVRQIIKAVYRFGQVSESFFSFIKISNSGWITASDDEKKGVGNAGDTKEETFHPAVSDRLRLVLKVKGFLINK